MAMKKIKPQYGKVIAPAVNNYEDRESTLELNNLDVSKDPQAAEKQANLEESIVRPVMTASMPAEEKPITRAAEEANPFLQTKEIFAKARLKKIGYRMRTDYVEILDIIKKIKKGGYTLEAVLDDAVTFYLKNSEDGREALRKAEIFYS